MARRSARLASASKASKSTTTAPNLSSLAERQDSPAAGATSGIDAIVSSPVHVPKTPADSTPAKPPMSEMHPSKVHATMGPPSSGLRLGFTDIQPSTAAAGDLPPATLATPSKIAIPSSPFTFRFNRPAAAAPPATDVELGPEARRMMDELREEAQKIKEDLIAKREAERREEEESQGNSRKIAQPKRKAGRFSAAHMAQFKKMDSIENHPSAYRAQLGGRSTFLAKGLKRTQSRANLNESDSGHSTPSKGLKRTQSRAHLAESDSVRSTKNNNTSANNHSGASSQSAASKGEHEAAPSAKRARKRLDDDDAPCQRPASRDTSFIPRPKSSGKDVSGSAPSLASLMTPTKSSLARAATVKTPTSSLVKSPSRSTLNGLQRSATASNVAAAAGAASTSTAPTVTIRSPKTRLSKVKSLLRGSKPSIPQGTSAAPVPSATSSISSSPVRLHKALPPLPISTPSGRKLVRPAPTTTPRIRKVEPETRPASVKSGIPRPHPRRVLGEVYYPTLDGVMAKDSGEDGGVVSYPDLSARKNQIESSDEQPKKTTIIPPAVPGTFTFRSDHTIRFGSASPTGFGASPGQSSVRHVRPSILPTAKMPGSFPSSLLLQSTSNSPNKENEPPTEEEEQPAFIRAVPHGIINKKRHRVSADGEDDSDREAAERAAKKRKAAIEEVPEDESLFAPRLLGALSAKKPQLSSPSRLRTPVKAGTPSPKKKPVLSLSRLHMLARPKLRK
ncbi:hypothetical protein VTK73DRAFT_5764 [Phialemonium thermophilum]|uniref:Erythromycin esterase n=1 Tax=Phialemonium thermophilum TaxID=223376 RepID=A0ABR3WLV6_9PEZI